MGKVTILPETTKDPISLAGRMSGIAYGSDTSNPKKNYKRGLECIESKHGRVLEYSDVYFKLEGYSIKVIREFARHTAGQPTFVQESTRYVNYKKGIEVVTPDSIYKKDCWDIWANALNVIQEAYREMVENGVPKEDASEILPLGMTTSLSCKYNARTLSGMASVRLCARAYWEFRDLMKDIITALENYSEEWKTISPVIFQCKCDTLGYCDEAFSCHRHPPKS